MPSKTANIDSELDFALAMQVLPSDCSLLVAVSAGPDSVALFHLVNHLKSQLKLRLAIAHVDHQLRADSCNDREFVQKLAIKANIPFHLKTLTPPQPLNNIEAWARHERYRFFSELRAEFNTIGY